jgi:hypothetical protein
MPAPAPALPAISRLRDGPRGGPLVAPFLMGGTLDCAGVPQAVDNFVGKTLDNRTARRPARRGRPPLKNRAPVFS